MSLNSPSSTKLPPRFRRTSKLLYTSTRKTSESVRSLSSSSPTFCLLEFANLVSSHKALITISHRPSLFKYHQYSLKLAGHDGEWEMSKIGGPDEHLSFQREINSLEEKLRDVDSWKVRLAELEKELAFSTS